MQEKYGKEPEFIKDQRQTVDKAVAGSKGCMYKLFEVIVTANGLIKGAKKDGSRRYYCVSRQRLNALRRALDGFRKQGGEEI